MKKKLIYIVSMLAVMTGLVVPMAVPVAADTFNVFPSSACNGNKICGSKGNTSPLYTIIKNVINLLLYAVGIIAVVMIVLGGLSYATSNGDQSKITSAKNTILYAVIGLVVAAMAFAIVNFVVTRLF